jgi:hypothetical protein
MRPEHYEVKGRQLVKPSHAGSRRNRVFTLKVLDLAQQLDVRLFTAVWRKDPFNPVDAMSMYTQGLQILAERFHYHCAQASERGVIVVDGRTRNLDFQVAASHLSYIFGNPTGRNYARLLHLRLLLPSEVRDAAGGLHREPAGGAGPVRSQSGWALDVEDARTSQASCCRSGSGRARISWASDRTRAVSICEQSPHAGSAR